MRVRRARLVLLALRVQQERLEPPGRGQLVQRERQVQQARPEPQAQREQERRALPALREKLVLRGRLDNLATMVRPGRQVLVAQAQPERPARRECRGRRARLAPRVLRVCRETREQQGLLVPLERQEQARPEQPVRLAQPVRPGLRAHQGQDLPVLQDRRVPLVLREKRARAGLRENPAMMVRLGRPEQMVLPVLPVPPVRPAPE